MNSARECSYRQLKLMMKAPMSKNFGLGHAELLEIFDGVKTGVEFTKVILSFLCLFCCLYSLSLYGYL